MELDCTIGNYCRSVAFSTVLRYYGYPFSEAMCFGLSAAFDFNSSKIRFGKHGEKQLYCFSGNNSNDIYYIADILQLDFQIIQTKNSRQAYKIIDRIINVEKSPLIARVCVKEYLSSMKSTATNHVGESNEIFNIIDTLPSNHVTVISHYGRKSVVIHEPNMVDPVILPPKIFSKALDPKKGVVSPSANILYLLRPTKSFEEIRFEMPSLLLKAIQDNMTQYLNPNCKFYGANSLKGVNEMLNEQMKVDEKKENMTMFRFFCDIVTGSGFYRRLYGRFLKEANELYFHNEELANCSKVYGRLSKAWSNLSKMLLKADIENEKTELNEQIKNVIDKEINAAQELYQIVGKMRNEL